MPFSLRLRLDSVLAADPTPGAPPRVTGLQLGFASRGANLSNAQRAAQVPAKLSFVGRFRSSIRDKPSPQEIAMGDLIGQIQLSGDPVAVTFTCDAASLSQLIQEPAPDDDTSDDPNRSFSPRSLDLVLGASFAGLESIGKAVPRLFLPNDSGQFRYLELCAKLSVAGAIEADFDQNDVLDVLIRLEPPPTFPFSL